MKKGPKSININTFLVLGIALIIIAIIIQTVFPTLSSAVTNIIYILGILAFIVYMLEIQYRRRTGDYNDEANTGSKKKKK